MDGFLPLPCVVHNISSRKCWRAYPLGQPPAYLPQQGSDFKTHSRYIDIRFQSHLDPSAAVTGLGFYILHTPNSHHQPLDRGCHALFNYLGRLALPAVVDPQIAALTGTRL